MEPYKIIIADQAFHDMDEIYCYIAFRLQVPRTAAQMLEKFQEAVNSLKQDPERGAFRKIGIYAGKTHRQLFVGNYTIIYRVNEEQKRVEIITVRYSPSRF